jgi:glycosyltransferase involved in cell wall biosynthesis
MIKVCHIITKLELGGAQQNTLYTVKSLDQSRFQPLLITGAEGLLVEEARTYQHVTQYYLPELVREIRPLRDMHAFVKLRAILRQERNDSESSADTPVRPMIVHTHSSKAGILGRWAAKAAGVPIIIHSIHGFGFHREQSLAGRALFIMLEWLTAKITTHFIAVSAANIATGKRLGFFDDSRVSLIRSGIDIARFAPPTGLSHAERLAQRARALQGLGIPESRRIIGMVACFKPQKAPLDFVRAMQVVTKTRTEAHAIIVGDGELRPQIEALIADLYLEKTISLLGWRTDVPTLLHLCDMLVLTSRWEGLPRVCPQAMAAGLPIVATAVDGTPEAVRDGVTGFVVPPGDVQQIAAKIIYLLDHSDLARQMGAAGQQHVREFDIQQMVRQQEQLYQQLVTSEKG